MERILAKNTEFFGIAPRRLQGTLIDSLLALRTLRLLASSFILGGVDYGSRECRIFRLKVVRGKVERAGIVEEGMKLALARRASRENV